MTNAAVNVPPPWSPPLVPGLPLLGSLLEFQRDRFGLERRVPREFGELARMRFGLFTVLLLSSARLAHEVLVEKSESFKKSAGLSVFARPVLGDGLLTSERDVHKRQRRMLAPVFAHKRIAGYGDVMVAKAETSAARLAGMQAGGQTVDLADEMMRLTLDIVGKTLFDAEMADEATPIGEALTTAMRQMMDSMVRLVPMPPSVPTPGNLRQRAAVKRLDEIVYRMIRERRASGKDAEALPGDMLSMLLATRDADDGSSLSDKEVRDQAMTLLLAGHETTANALAWTFYLLARHPEVRARMEAELGLALGTRRATAADLPALPYTLQVLKEAMRLYPPAHVLGRAATEDVTVGRAMVRKGQVVLVNIVGIHRRPEAFPDPDRFDPDRFTPEREKQLPVQAYMPFGAGPRVCIGNHFALMEGHLILATLARRFRFELVGDAAVRGIDAEPLVTLRPKGGVPVKVVAR